MVEFIGIDPGKSGYLTWLHPNRTIELIALNRETIEIIEFITHRLYREIELKVLIEKVHSMPGQGVSSTFTFGKEFGKIIGIIETIQALYDESISLDFVTPRTWMKYYEVGTRKEFPKTWKDRLRFKAQSIFKGKRISKVSADSVLIANYARIIHEQENLKRLKKKKHTKSNLERT